jgi:hypothetical protein
MKRLYFLSTIILLVFTVGSCKKNSLAGAQDIAWRDSLSNTVWAVKFQSPEAIYTGLQPASLELHSDGTMDWNELVQDYPGSWDVTGNMITIHCHEGAVTANLTKDGWSNFATTFGDPKFTIAGVSPTSIPSDYQLDNSHWIGQYGLSSAISLVFSPGDRLSCALLKYNDTYTMSGAGIRLLQPFPDGTRKINFFVFSYNATTLIGSELTLSPDGSTQNILWSAKRQ